MDHHAAVGATAAHDGYLDKDYSGRRSTSVYIPRFRNVTTARIRRSREASPTRCTPGARAGSERSGAHDDRRGVQGVADRPGPWWLYTESYGECLPRQENHVSLNRREAGQVGHADARHRHDVRPERDVDAEGHGGVGGRDAGGRGIPVDQRLQNQPHPGEVIHEMGTARMGRDPKTSVLNAFNQCHDAPNVFVTDGSCMVSTACQNPSLHLHGAHRACLRLRRRPIEARGAVRSASPARRRYRRSPDTHDRPPRYDTNPVSYLGLSSFGRDRLAFRRVDWGNLARRIPDGRRA